MLVTSASTNDIKAMEYIVYEKGSFYIFDWGYNSFADLYRIHRLEAYFFLEQRIISNSEGYIPNLAAKKASRATKLEFLLPANRQVCIPKSCAKYVIMMQIRTENLFF
jgi:hypothetical protein